MQILINDYLSPDIAQIRHGIRGIDDSYNNAWDIYAELTQNAVDAIRQSESNPGLIKLSIDSMARSIKIYDNGVGIDRSMLPSLLKPFSTNKANIDIAVGEKGVGLKFVIFSSSYFHIKTGNSAGSAEAEILEASNWKKSTSNEFLPLRFEDFETPFQGTEIEVRGVDNEDIFNLSFKQLEYVLRTRTSLGSTKPIWGNDRNITVELEYRDINSETFRGQIPFKYLLVTDNIPQGSKIDLEEFMLWLRSADRTDQEKIGKVKDKVIFKKGEFVHTNQRIIKYFACFVPKRKVWNDLSVDLGLATKENLEDDEWLSNYDYCKFNSGIHVSVKGMPTGITLDHPATGYAGYWANFFMIFEDPFVKFDIGRKSLHGRQANIHKDYAKAIFNDFLQYVTKYVSGEVAVDPTEWDRDEIFSEIDGMVSLNNPKVKFEKSPVDQEASVVAIFFECIGSGMIQEITPLICGYRGKYDLYALWNRRRMIIEFKSHLSNLVRDFDDVRKMFDEMDCVVCWEVTDNDVQRMKNLGVNVEEASVPMFANKEKIFPYSTHVMTLANFVKPIFVIDLKRLISR